MHHEALASITAGETALIAGSVAIVVGLFSVGANYLIARRADVSATRASQAAADSVILNTRVAEAAALRAEEDGRSRLYQEAAQQLGHEKAPVRLAGVYAMARLADDWPDQRQTCIDVLCAYLRMPFPGDDAEEQVRRAAWSVLVAHWTAPADAATSWLTNNFDFRGATLYDVRLDGITFEGMTDFTHVTFKGSGAFQNISLANDGCFDWADIAGTMFFKNIATGTDNLLFRRVAVRKECSLYINIDTNGQTTYINSCEIQGFMDITIPNTGSGTSQLIMNNLTVDESGIVTLLLLRHYHDGDKDSHNDKDWPYVQLAEWHSNGGAVHASRCLLESTRIYSDLTKLPEGVLTIIEPHERPQPPTSSGR